MSIRLYPTSKEWFDTRKWQKRVKLISGVECYLIPFIRHITSVFPGLDRRLIVPVLMVVLYKKLMFPFFDFVNLQHRRLRNYIRKMVREGYLKGYEEEPTPLERDAYDEIKISHKLSGKQNRPVELPFYNLRKLVKVLTGINLDRIGVEIVPFSSTFKTTPATSAIACCLASPRSVEEISTLTGYSTNTVSNCLCGFRWLKIVKRRKGKFELTSLDHYVDAYRSFEDHLQKMLRRTKTYCLAVAGEKIDCSPNTVKMWKTSSAMPYVVPKKSIWLAYNLKLLDEDERDFLLTFRDYREFISSLEEPAPFG